MAVLVRRRPELVAALLGILRSGGAYVALDPSYPAARREYMLRDSEASLLLAEEELLSLTDSEGPPVVVLEELLASGEAPAPLAPSSRLAYVIYTSGSTGRPKGVAITHRSAVGLVRWAGHAFRPEELASVLASTSVCFDLSIFELFVPLSCGGRVVLVENLLAAEELSEVSLINTVPSAIAEILRQGDLPASVRVVNLAGEALSGDLVRSILQRSSARVLNLYGPSEDTTYSTFVEASLAPSREPSIGRPLWDTQAYVLDARGGVLPLGTAGDLWLGGENLARGYLGRAGASAWSFVPNPFSGVAGSRMYRTGDVARRLTSGELEFLGRRDHQVKVRGFRIELGEVESVLVQNAGVHEAGLTVRGDRLVAFWSPSLGDSLESSELSRFLSEHLPAHMVPSSFVELEALPRTTNGKLDRRALSALPVGDEESESVYVEPLPGLETRLAEIWSEVLECGPVGRDQSFFHLGGHSLLVYRVVSRIRHRLGISLALRDLFEAPSVAALAAVIESRAGSAALPPIERRDSGVEIPLSFAQQRLWFLAQLEPNSPRYNMPGAFRLRGPLALGALQASLWEVVRRHGILRTIFPVDENPRQEILDFRPESLPLVDLAALGLHRHDALSRLARAHAQRPFDLVNGPLFRVLLVRLAVEEHALLINLHHIVTDGWSLRVLREELAQLYTAFAAGRPSPLAEPELQYADFACWQQRWLSAEALSAQKDYWQRQLTGAPETLELPTDRPRPSVQTFAGASWSLPLPKVLEARLGDLGRRLEATPFMTFLAAFQLLLARLTGQRDLLLGTPTANREPVELESLMGFFVNTLVIRGRVRWDEDFHRHLERVRTTCLGAYAHQDLPFEQLVEQLQPERDPSRSPLFQMVFAAQEISAATVSLGEVMLEDLDLAGGQSTRFDLELQLLAAPQGSHLVCTWNRDLFDSTSIKRLLARFVVLLGSIAEEPESAVDSLALLPRSERFQVLREWSDTVGTYPRHLSLPALFERVVEGGPATVAMVFGETHLSYRELDLRANRLARELLASGVGPESRVGLFVESSVEMLVGVLGILKAGGAYVPLDLEYPEERLEFMLRDAQQGVDSAVLVTRGPLLERLPANRGTVVDLDHHRGPVGPREGEAPVVSVAANNLAYAMYTSGSTGRPKAVCVIHRSIARLALGANYLRLGPGDRMVLSSNSSFDAATFEIWGPLLTGATIIGLAREVLLSPAALGEALRRHSAQVFFLTTALFNQMVREDPAIFSGIRHLLFGGEAVDPQWVRKLLRSPGWKGRLLHFYGPTESTAYASWHPVGFVPADASSIPIGRAVSHTTLHVLEAGGGPAAIGMAGELAIGGDGLARGYHGQSGLTASVFVPDGVSGAAGERLYLTGDQVRLGVDGALEFVGRRDNQVKIRGFRIEPGEVGAVLLQLPELTQAVVLVLRDERGELRLVAYIVPAAGVLESGLPARLRESLRGRLPDYMQPSEFVVLGTLPLTPNGKVDRAALPAPQWGNTVSYRPPRTALEEILAGFWSELLALERVGLDDDFFTLGGHSLLAVQLVSRVRQGLGLELPLATLFEARTLVAVAEALETIQGGSEREPVPPLRRRQETGPAPLSFSQQRLWFLDQLQPGSLFYNVPLALRLEGELDAAAFAAAVVEITRRHEVLRTAFRRGEDGGPVQEVCTSRSSIPYIDLLGLPEARRGQAMERLERWEAQQPFDLTAGQPLRVLLLRCSVREHRVLVTMHHIVSDGWSLDRFLLELGALYEAAASGRSSPLPEPAVQYADYAAWQREVLSGPRLEQGLGYWRRHLDGLSEPAEIPTDRPRPETSTFRGALAHRRLPLPPLERLQHLARRRNATLFMVLQAAFKVLLWRVTESRDLVVGSPVANRDRVEIEGLIGFFVNTLVLRSHLESGVASLAFPELLAQVQGESLAAYAHQEVPFELLVEALAPERSLGRSPLFQVMLVLQNTPLSMPRFPGLEMVPSDRPPAATPLDLTLSMTEGPEGLEILAHYRTELFDGTTVARWLTHFTTLLEDLSIGEEKTLRELAWLSPPERQQVVVEWDGRAAEAAAPGLLHALFEARVEQGPEAIAVCHGAVQWSYGALDRRADELARHLVSLGVGPEVLVGLCSDRRPELLIGLLGILKAGGGYVPMDPRYPQERLAWMLETTQVPVLLTRERFRELLPEGPDHTTTFCLDGCGRLEGEEPVAADVQGTTSKAHPHNTAYIIFTSGSTGRPKGVVVPHRAFANLHRSQRELFRVGPGSRVLQFSSISFDASVFEIVMALGSGATLCLPLGDGPLLGEDLASFLRDQRVSLATLSPSTLSSVPQVDLRAFRTLTVAGEFCPAELVERWAPERRFFNLYGPTETTIWASAAHCRAGESTTLGRPFDGLRVVLCDALLEPVPVATPGELCIGGIAVTRGYLGQPGRTAESFVPDPTAEGTGGQRLYRTGDLASYRPDGRLEFLGRIDRQLKVRGFRIEPGEIESRILELAGVREAAVGVVENRLVAWVAMPDGEWDEGALRERLQTTLPDFMVPALFVRLEGLPLTPNGKLDREALTVPRTAARSSEVTLGTPLEDLLRTIWADVLDLESIEGDADFFELGGHSLQAVKVISRIRRALEIDLSVRSLFEAPTLSAQAIQVEQQVREGEESPLPPLVPVSGEGPFPLSYSQEQLWFIDQVEPGNPAYNLPVVIHLEGTLNVPALAATLGEIVRRHDVLRGTYGLVEGEPRMWVSPAGPVPLPQVDLGALPAERQQTELVRRMGSEIFRSMDLARGPLARALLVSLAPGEFAFALTFHHIAFDAWSLGVLLREVVALYGAAVAVEVSPLPELAVQYQDFTFWQKSWLASERAEVQRAYWKERLAGAPTLSALPLDKPRPRVLGHRGRILSQRLSKSSRQALETLGRQREASLYMTLLAAFYALLHHEIGSDDLVIGTDVANREHTGLEPLIGFFVNQLVLRADLSGDPSFNDLLARVREVTVGAYAHAALPFEMLVEASGHERSLAYSPLFQIKLIINNTPPPEGELPDLTLRPFEGSVNPTAKLDLVVNLREDEGGMLCEWNYSTDLFETKTIQRWMDGFAAVLARVLDKPQIPLSELGRELEEQQRRKKTVATEKRRAKRFSKLKKVVPQAVAPSRTPLVKLSQLAPEQPLPLVIEPTSSEVDLEEWVEDARDLLEEKLAEHGAILFRGFAVDSPPVFESFATTVCSDLYQENGEHPRESVSGNVATPVFYPPEEKLLWHNENTFNLRWPMKIFFCCARPADQGGETPLVDSGAVFDRIRPEVREKFLEKGVMYVRNYGVGLGLSWREVFQVEDKAEAEQHCRENRIDFEWGPEERLRTRAVRPAAGPHPGSGRMSWFNQAQHFHTACLDEATRRSMEAIYEEDEMPRNCYYGDGSVIEDSVMEEILAIYEDLEISFPWRKGDVLLVDNMRVAHGRNPYVGERKLLVAMGEVRRHDSPLSPVADRED